jgi:hypothetical protein
VKLDLAGNLQPLTSEVGWRQARSLGYAGEHSGTYLFIIAENEWQNSAVAAYTKKCHDTTKSRDCSLIGH